MAKCAYPYHWPLINLGIFAYTYLLPTAECLFIATHGDQELTIDPHPMVIPNKYLRK